MAALHSAAKARLLALSPLERRAVIKALPPSARQALVYSWEFHARPDQLWRPGNETYTAFLAGRGYGKTRVGAEAVQYVAAHPEHCGGRAKQGPTDDTYGRGGVIGIAGRTANDVNETMLYGPSGIMSIAPPWFRPRHIASRKILEWPNGVIARLFSGDVPDSFRGPNIGFLWPDELVHWKRCRESWMNARMTLRHGTFPRCVITTTPLGTQELLEIVYECDSDGVPIAAPGGGFLPNPRTRVVYGSSYDNAANLAAPWLKNIVAEFEGSEVGDQELRGVILMGVKGALWRRDWIRRVDDADVPKLVAVVVAIDPTVSDGQTDRTGKVCETGIVAMGLGEDRHLYLLEDASGIYDSEGWARKALELYVDHGADWIAAEDNQGGELIETNIRHHAPRNVRYKIQRVRATRSKGQRASLVAGLWQAGKVHHVGDGRRFLKMEHQICTFDPNKSEDAQPTDRMDALTWGALALLAGGEDRRRLAALSDVEAWERIRDAIRSRVAA